MDGIESMGMEALVPESALPDRNAMGPAPHVEQITSRSLAEAPDEKKKQLAKDFESVLLTRLFSEVKESIGSCGFGEDPASDQIHSMFWSFLAQDVADKGGFGLWQDLYQHFKDLEGVPETGGLIDKEL
jgi:Rod binding domain-containing protein